MIIPNFFIVGTAKTGTTFIGNYLSQHPEIYISPIKEPHFFCEDICMADFRQNYRERVIFDIKKYLENYPLPHKHIAHIDELSQYLELFREVENEKAIGELSVGYLYSNCAAENLFKFNPNAKIIMILRQPVERAYSHYLMNISAGLDYHSGFIDALKRDFISNNKGWGRSHLYVELGLYFEQITRYQKFFPENQIKIFLYEDLKNHPKKFFNDCFEFLEVSQLYFSEKMITERKNTATFPRLKILDEYLSIFNIIRKRLPNKIKTQIKKILLTDKNIPKLQEDEFTQAIKYFNDDIQKLSIVTNKDLKSWYKISK